ncbi:polysaccharide biosynthesis/export family protein [Povalibacter sp.]|uniref:polysaccharide biosynthesis/export family protein n=1 Tax=Povalibacter sp. TaxID=1962978 RepID=UPI002F4144D8
MRTDNGVNRARNASGGFSLWAGLLLALFASGAFANGNADYKVGPGDLVKITVYGAPDMSTEVRVAETGGITCPLIGAVEVAGLSTSEIEKLLVTRYVDGGFLRQPQIAVLITEFLSQKISVLGHVTKPGQYPQRGAANVLGLLAEAGGVQALSAADRATLTRVDGTQAEIDLRKLFDGDPSQNLTVSGGDRIYVPKADEFYVYGQVQKPGQYKLERNMTVSRAISASGGLTARGTERRAIVKRRGTDGKEKEHSVKGTDLLQPDDILFIKESLF